MSWTEAQRCCRENFTDMVTIFNSDINELLMTMVQKRNDINVAGAWIGLYDNVYSWKWSMGDKSIYIDGKHEFLTWFKGQPNNLNGNQHCMVIEGTKELNLCLVILLTLSCVLMVRKSLRTYPYQFKITWARCTCSDTCFLLNLSKPMAQQFTS